MAELLGKNLTYEGRRLVIPAEGGVFGRDPRNHLVVTHESVSSLHGTFRVENGALLVRDQQSTNGTRVNGKEITDHPVHDGDRLEIGDLLFLVYAPEFTRREAGPAPSAPASEPPPAPARATPPPPVSSPTAGFLETPALRNTLAGAALIIAVVVAFFLYVSRLGSP